ncbi:hypothetical protein HDU87_000154 [Geranomyces variabilis]|uniref:Uncharacterized protein n=1 Tax=Geranomyces variabilis TaxID=109894 RepID=A0AAD5XV21_9FUNG|nr:hypothetical protein HDU87_000154 [Geranomyces variabilis]
MESIVPVPIVSQQLDSTDTASPATAIFEKTDRGTPVPVEYPKIHVLASDVAPGADELVADAWSSDDEPTIREFASDTADVARYLVGSAASSATSLFKSVARRVSRSFEATRPTNVDFDTTASGSTLAVADANTHENIATRNAGISQPAIIVAADLSSAYCANNDEAHEIPPAVTSTQSDVLNSPASSSITADVAPSPREAFVKAYTETSKASEQRVKHALKHGADLTIEYGTTAAVLTADAIHATEAAAAYAARSTAHGVLTTAHKAAQVGQGLARVASTAVKAVTTGRPARDYDTGSDSDDDVADAEDASSIVVTEEIIVCADDADLVTTARADNLADIVAVAEHASSIGSPEEIVVRAADTARVEDQEIIVAEEIVVRAKDTNRATTARVENQAEEEFVVAQEIVVRTEDADSVTTAQADDLADIVAVAEYGSSIGSPEEIVIRAEDTARVEDQEEIIVTEEIIVRAEDADRVTTPRADDLTDMVAVAEHASSIGSPEEIVGHAENTDHVTTSRADEQVVEEEVGRAQATDRKPTARGDDQVAKNLDLRAEDTDRTTTTGVADLIETGTQREDGPQIMVEYVDADAQEGTGIVTPPPTPAGLGAHLGDGLPEPSARPATPSRDASIRREPIGPSEETLQATQAAPATSASPAKPSHRHATFLKIAGKAEIFFGKLVRSSKLTAKGQEKKAKAKVEMAAVKERRRSAEIDKHQRALWVEQRKAEIRRPSEEVF